MGIGPTEKTRRAREQRARNPYNLTDAEVRVAQIAANGLSNKEIARLLRITEQTVKFHMTQVLVKLDVRNRTELANAWILGVTNKKAEDESMLTWMVRVGGPSCENLHCGHTWCGWVRFIRINTTERA